MNGRVILINHYVVLVAKDTIGAKTKGEPTQKRNLRRPHIQI